MALFETETLVKLGSVPCHKRPGFESCLRKLSIVLCGKAILLFIMIVFAFTIAHSLWDLQKSFTLWVSTAGTQAASAAGSTFGSTMGFVGVQQLFHMFNKDSVFRFGNSTSMFTLPSMSYDGFSGWLNQSVSSVSSNVTSTILVAFMSRFFNRNRP